MFFVPKGKGQESRAVRGGGCIRRVLRVVRDNLPRTRLTRGLSSCRRGSLTSTLAILAPRRHRGICATLNISAITRVFSCLSSTRPCLGRLSPRQTTQIVSRVSSSSTISTLSSLRRSSGTGVIRRLSGSTTSSIGLLLSCRRSRVNDYVAAGCVYVHESVAVQRTVDRLIGRTNRGSGVSALCIISRGRRFCNTVSLGSLVITHTRSRLRGLVTHSCPCIASRRGVDSYVSHVISCTRHSLPILGSDKGLLNVVASTSIIRLISSRVNSSCTGLNNLADRRSLGRNIFRDIGGHLP